jgi:hypothetical protein
LSDHGGFANLYKTLILRDLNRLGIPKGVLVCALHAKNAHVRTNSVEKFKAHECITTYLLTTGKRILKNEKGLLGEFTCTGMWWLPSNPTEKIYGLLKFKRDYIELEISGVFSKAHAFQRLRLETLHGLTNENKKITLYQVSEQYFSGPHLLESDSKNNFGESVFSCEYIFIGRHFDHVDDIIFNCLYMNFTYLNKWINNKLESKREEGVYHIKTESFIYKLNLESISSTLQISSDPIELGDFQTDIRISYVSHMLITPYEAKNWKWFQEFINNLKNLLTLLFGLPVYPTHLSADPIDKSKFESVEIYYCVSNPLIIEDLHPRDIEIPFSDIIQYANRNNQKVADIMCFRRSKFDPPRRSDFDPLFKLTNHLVNKAHVSLPSPKTLSVHVQNHCVVGNPI